MTSEEDPVAQEPPGGPQARVRALIDAIQEERGLSEAARKVLRHLSESGRILHEISVDELKETILEALR